MKSSFNKLLDLMSKEVTEAELIEFEINARISAKVSEYRIDRKMSVSAMAKELGISYNRYSRWENEYHDFKVSEIALIQSKLGIKVI